MKRKTYYLAIVRNLLVILKSCLKLNHCDTHFGMKKQSLHRKKFIGLAPTWLLAVFLLLPNLLTAPSTHASQEEIHHYRKVTGKTALNATWQLEKNDGYTLTYTSGGEIHVTVTDKEYNTLSWYVVGDDGKTNFRAVRNGGSIALSGRYKGEVVDKRLEIDDRPWYQATSLSLRGFIACDDDKRIFWTIRFSALTVHKIKAIKKKVVSSETGCQLQHIRLTLPGMLAPFWKSDYWFSLPECVFFRFEGPSGPPGSPDTTVTLTTG